MNLFSDIAHISEIARTAGNQAAGHASTRAAPYTFAGLPLHVLLVHAVVVLTPLTAIAVILHAVWPTAARRLGVVTPLGGLVLVIIVPVTVSAGQALEDELGSTPAIRYHAALGRTLLPWVIALFVIGLAEWSWTTLVPRLARDRAPAAVARPVRIALIVGAIVIAGGTIVDVVLIGDAGARAVWGTTA